MELTKGEWGCPHCGRGFPSHAAMSGHKRHCRPFHGALQYGQGEGDEGVEFGMQQELMRKEEVEEREELRQREGQGSEATTLVEEKENQPLTQDAELVSRHRGQLKRKRDTAHTTAQGMA